MPRIRAEVSMLTVKTATELLASLGRKPNYRPLSKNRIAQYVAAIKSGRWRDNGNTIGIDPEGVMINGQHRCHAVIIAKQSIPVIFVYGIRYIEEIDTHQPRTLQQLLNYRGEKNAHILSACLRMVFDYQGGYMRSHRGKRSGSNEEYLGMLKKHGGLRYSATKSHGVSKICSVCAIAFCHHMGPFKCKEELDQDFVDEFIRGIGEGSDMKKRDPRYVLREIAIDERRKRKGRSGICMDSFGFLACCIKAWNFYVLEQECPRKQSLRWISAGPREEPFPTFLEE